MPAWNPHVYPHGGYVFIDADGVQHSAASLQALIAKLADYRVRRGIPVGNPTAEVNEYLCRLYPGKCRNTPLPTPEALAKTRENNISASVMAWLRGVWECVARRIQKYVSDEEVARRAAICQSCVHHETIASDCASCAESANQVSFQLRAGHDKHSSQLKKCTFFGTDLRLDATLDQTARPDAPDNCWKKAL